VPTSTRRRTRIRKTLPRYGRRWWIRVRKVTASVGRSLVDGDRGASVMEVVDDTPVDL